jgi:hypothetical protein
MVEEVTQIVHPIQILFPFTIEEDPSLHPHLILWQELSVKAAAAAAVIASLMIRIQ